MENHGKPADERGGRKAPPTRDVGQTLAERGTFLVTTRTIIEFATAADAVEIGELSRRQIEHDLRWMYKPSRIRESIRSKSKNVVVARESRALAGFGIMTYQADSANLDLLAVKTRYRRRGVGRQIVTWLEKVAHTAGITNIFVQVRKSNRGAIRFYKRLGYHGIGEAARYYQGRESAVIMCKGIRQMTCRARNFDAKRYLPREAGT